jgi:hypothetical protein
VGLQQASSWHSIQQRLPLRHQCLVHALRATCHMCLLMKAKAAAMTTTMICGDLLACHPY